MSSSVDPTAEFEPGMFAQLKLLGNDIVVGVSDGTAPLGIIDDVRTVAFTKSQVDEIIVIDAGSTEISEHGDVVNSNDVKGELEFPSVIENSFVSTVSIVLNSVNGVITVPEGTELNYDSDNDGVNDSFKVVVSYIYRIANKPGDDTTIGSGRVTVHYQRGIYATDQFDTTQIYPLNATLYVGLDGKITSSQATENHPGVAFVTGPPSATNGTIEFVLL